MKQKPAILVLCISVCISCAQVQDLDILGIDGNIGWESELMCLKNANSILLNNSGIRLVDYERIDINTLTIENFFNTNAKCYPVYSTSLSKFELTSLPFIETDTTTLHFDVTQRTAYLNKLLSKRSCINAVNLIWKDSLDNLFNTYALFDDMSGELLYDNILLNIITEISSDDCTPSLLSRGENGEDGQYGDNFEIVYFVHNNVTLAHASLTWEDYGHWEDSLVYIDNEAYQYRKWIHDSSSHVINVWVYPPVADYVSALGNFLDNSSQNYGMYRYYLWVGPTSAVPDDFYQGLNSPGDEVSFNNIPCTFGNSVAYSQGFAKWKMISYNPVLIPID